MKKLVIFLLITTMIFVFVGCTNDYDLKKANGIADNLAIVISSYAESNGNLASSSIEITLAENGNQKTFTVDIIPINDQTTLAALSNHLSDNILDAITDSNIDTFDSAIIKQYGRDIAAIDEHYVLTALHPFDLD